MPELLKKTQGELVYEVSPQLMACPHVRHAFFTRTGGVSTGSQASLNFRFTGDQFELAKQNYDIGAHVLGHTCDDVARTYQTHTDIIQVVRERPGAFAYDPEIPAFDGILTNVKGVCLTGFYADCQLLLLYDRKNQAIGAVHSGWRGVQQQIARKAIERMTAEYGTRPDDLVVAVSPSICRNCFETDDDVYEALTQSYGEQITDYMYQEAGKWHIDLKNITYQLLVSTGVLPYNIDISGDCPCCGDETLYWSHRRNGNDRGVHAAMICLV